MFCLLVTYMYLLPEGLYSMCFFFLSAEGSFILLHCSMANKRNKLYHMAEFWLDLSFTFIEASLNSNIIFHGKLSTV